MKRSSESSVNGFVDTASGNQFAIFEIIADAKRIQGLGAGGEIANYAKRIEQQADGIVQSILGTAEVSTQNVTVDVIEQIIELLRVRNSPER